jgi:hypothetical protein
LQLESQLSIDAVFAANDHFTSSVSLQLMDTSESSASSSLDSGGCMQPARMEENDIFAGNGLGPHPNSSPTASFFAPAARHENGGQAFPMQQQYQQRKDLAELLPSGAAVRPEHMCVPNPCAHCGEECEVVHAVGLPTHSEDVIHLLPISRANIMRCFDPQLQGERVQTIQTAANFFVSGDVFVPLQAASPLGPPLQSTTRMPPLFRQACQLFDRMARMAASTATSPPTLEL